MSRVCPYKQSLLTQVEHTNHELINGRNDNDSKAEM
jgi:hypothetical protein